MKAPKPTNPVNFIPVVKTLPNQAHFLQAFFASPLPVSIPTKQATIKIHFLNASLRPSCGLLTTHIYLLYDVAGRGERKTSRWKQQRSGLTNFQHGE